MADVSTKPYFIRAFKQVTDMAPQEYRRRLEKGS